MSAPHPVAVPGFRCSAASADVDEPMEGTASTVPAFLLVEAPGPWGVDGPATARLPQEVTHHLGRLERRHKVRPLVIRGHGRQRSGGTRVFAAHVRGAQPWVETAVLDRPQELLDLSVEGLATGTRPGLTPYDEPLYCVCTHGKHDVCCAERGRPLCRALHAVDPEHTWEVSHIGGDRFAPNVLVLPAGLYYGRLGPEDAEPFVAGHRDGMLDLAHLRGRCAFGFAVQAAEIHLRRRLGLREVAPLEVTSVDRDGDLTRVVFIAAGAPWEVRVRSYRGDSRQLTCRAAGLGAGLSQELVGLAPVA